MIFRSDCRFLGGFTEIGVQPIRICALTGCSIVSCDGCNTFKSIHEPCETCNVFQLCKNQSEIRASGSVGEIREPFDDSNAPKPATMLATQIYSGKIPDPDEPSTPIPADIRGAKRHLIYHIWPKSGNGVWQWNVKELLKRIVLFDGVRTIGIAVGSYSDSVEDVKAAFAGHRIDNWIIRANSKSAGEAATFRQMMATLPGDGVTFYGHAKGVKHSPTNPAIRIWTDLMLRHCLDDWTKIESTLSSFPVAGCFRQHFHVVKPFGTHRWHFAGTHWWFRNKDVFERPEWREMKDGYYSVEVWPGRLFKRSEAACLFADDCDNTSSFGDLYSIEAMRGYRELAGIKPPSLSVVIATLGRPSLAGVVESLKKQLRPEDELIVIADGPEAAGRTRAIVECTEHSDPQSAFGNAQKRFGMNMARRDWIWFVDDDDQIADNAVETIKSTLSGRPVVFRMDHMGDTIWKEPNASMGNVGTPMLVVPNRPEIPRFPASNVYSADNQWINEVIEDVGVEWSEEVIYHVEQHSVGV
jgi:hypothetical protein